MNVLMVTREYPPFEVGGIARHTYCLVRYLRRLGVECTVLSFGDPGCSGGDVVFVKPRSSIISRRGSRIVEDVRVPVEIARLTVKARELLSTGSFDLLHVQEPYVGGFVGYDGRKVTTIHDTSYGEMKGIVNHPLTLHNFKRAVFYVALGYLMEFTSIRSSRVLIAPSYEVKYELTRVYGVPEGKVEVIPNGVEPPSSDEPSREEAKTLCGLPQDKILIFTTAQHVARKRLDILVKAVKILRERGVDGFLVVVGGEGPLTPSLKTLVRRYSLESYVRFTGWIPDSRLPVYYRAADIFVVTSDYEAGPMTLLEAGVRGAALVCSRIGGFASMMRDRVDGLLFPPGNPSRLADLLEKLIADEGLRRRLGCNAERFASRFTWRNVAVKTKTVYESLVEK